MYIESRASDHLQASLNTLQTLTNFKQENVVLNSLSKDCHWPAHRDNFSLKFAFSGQEYYGLGRRTLGVCKDNFLVVNNDQPHSSWIQSDVWVNSFAIYYQPAFVANVVTSLITPDDHLLERPLHSIGQSLYFPEQLFSLGGVLDKTIRHFKNGLEANVFSDFSRDEILRDILVQLIFQYRKDVVTKINSLPVVKHATRVEIYKRIQVAKDYLDTFFTQPVTVAELAREAAMADNHLLKHFKQLHGLSPHQYLINKRLSMAKELLRKSAYTVIDVVQKIGFEDASSFCRLFRRRYHVTPLEFRRTNRA